MNLFRICFFGPSGSGKSTCAKFAISYFKRQGFATCYLNAATPLHQIQKYSYRKFNITNSGQDGKFLQFLASHFEKNLGPNLIKQIAVSESRYVNKKLATINSDCRNNTYPYLKKLGFFFIKVSANPKVIAKRLSQRGDISLAQNSHRVEQSNHIHPHLILQNNKSKKSLEINLEKIFNIYIKDLFYCDMQQNPLS